MDGTTETAERLDESADEMTPDDYARLGRVMARVLFAAWRGSLDRDADDDGA